MSVTDIVDRLDCLAHEALFKAKAFDSCSRHGVTIRIGDYEAERLAFAIGTNLLKQRDEMFLREDLMSAIQHELDVAADDECPACAYERDE